MLKLIFVFFPALLSLLSRDSAGLECSPMTRTEKIYDGPYVSYRADQVFVQYVIDNNGALQVKTDSFPVRDKASIRLRVGTDVPGETFTVYLKDKLRNEKPEYRRVERQFVISDIEGNFSALRRLLIAGGVIDSAFKWTFGDGHLVLGGDFVDRGQHVTEVLWLVYSLEEQADRAGGHVHFILGNHEIMNLSGDLRYVHNKYFTAANLIGKHYLQFFAEDSEFGRWLRTKNIVEKVGNHLYAHGGISAEVNRLGLTVSQLNELARPFYHDSTYVFPDPRLDTIMAELGPFWYRGYYAGTPRATQQTVDSSVALFGVRQIVTGHTVVGDSVSTWFDRKVINTDVPHIRGISEALYVEGNNYFRVLPDGTRKPL
ncbi:MAG TPA: metallophosphoesterase [Chitinophagaceae bacterium]|nr:metallophosphoesterase [Chitinophagaceae bacterium]